MRLISTRKVARFILVIWAISPFFIQTDLNGFETNTAFLFLSLVTYFYFKYFERSGWLKKTYFIYLGLLLGLGVLARIDMLFLVPAVALSIYFLNRKIIDFNRVSLMLGVVSLVILPWLVYCLLIGKSPIHTGGQSVRFLCSSHPFWATNTVPSYAAEQMSLRTYYFKTVIIAFNSLARIFDKVFPLPAGLFLILIWVSLNFRSFLKETKRLLFLYIFFCFLFLAYSFYIFGQWRFDRYFAPVTLGYLLILAIAFKEIEWSKVFFNREGLLRCLKIVILGMVLFILLFRSVNLIKDTLGHKESSRYYRVAEWVNVNTPKDAIIGVFQGGIIGYYLDRRFYCLDFKVNYNALLAMNNGQMDEYIKKNKVDYIIDERWVLDDFFVKYSKDKEFLNKQQLIRRDYFDIYRINSERMDKRGE